jgi:hypothetical protein
LNFTQEKCYIFPEKSLCMSRTWQTDEVICQLADADLDELAEVIEGSGSGATEALAEWIREGNAPKGLYDAVIHFTRGPDQSFDPVDWEALVGWIRAESGDDNDDF